MFFLQNFLDSRGISSTTLYIILGIATGIIVLLLAVVLLVVFRRRDSGVTNSPDRSKKGYVKGNVKGGNETNPRVFSFVFIKIWTIFYLTFPGTGKVGKADNPPDL